jgi:hypothetical protein
MANRLVHSVQYKFEKNCNFLVELMNNTDVSRKQPIKYNKIIEAKTRTYFYKEKFKIG